MSDSQPPEDMAALKLQLELERLDRSWMEQEQQYLTSACGNIQGGWMRTGLGPANPVLGILAGIVVIVFGFAYLSLRRMAGVGLFGIIAGIVTLAVASAMLRGQIRNRRAYHEAKQRYESQRQELLQAIAASKGKSASQKD